MKLATLTSAGWISDPVNKLSRLFDDFLTTEASQSLLFREDIVSFQDFIQKFQHDPVLLAMRIESSLGALLSKYFDSAVTSIKADEAGDDGRYNITFDVVITQDGVAHSLGRVVELSGSEIVNVTIN